MEAQELYLRLTTAVAVAVALLQLEPLEVAARQAQAVMAPRHQFPAAALLMLAVAVAELMAIPAQIKALAARAVVARVARLHQITV
jgi:hypothetical protein